MDAVFKALADPSRRLLLDQLYRQDGQALEELTSCLEMSRYGVMKHLRVLKDAGLITTRRAGRRKLHFLNAVPIREIHDRWIGKYSEPWARALTGLKSHLEEEIMKPPPRHVFQIFIRTTPDRLWEAITSAEWTHRYFYDTRVESSWKAGAPVNYRYEDGRAAVIGTVLEVDPPRRLVTTWSFQYSPEVAADPPSRVTWEIEAVGEGCKLTLVHDEFTAETATYRAVGGGWMGILSSLKSLLERGEPLDLSASSPNPQAEAIISE